MKYLSFDNSAELRKYREERRYADGGNMNKDPEFWKEIWIAFKSLLRKK